MLRHPTSQLAVKTSHITPSRISPPFVKAGHSIAPLVVRSVHTLTSRLSPSSSCHDRSDHGTPVHAVKPHRSTSTQISASWQCTSRRLTSTSQVASRRQRKPLLYDSRRQIAALRLSPSARSTAAQHTTRRQDHAITRRQCSTRHLSPSHLIALLAVSPHLLHHTARRHVASIHLTSSLVVNA